MLNAALEHRRANGTPQILTNSYGFTYVPGKGEEPGSPILDPQHPLNRKVLELVASGATLFFAAGNCGTPCPSSDCDQSGIGPGRSIHGPNSLEQVITVAAVDSLKRRIGYSSHGSGLLFEHKPDLASYTHLCANFGEGRPGGDGTPFDSGTSAACPVAAGVAALMVQAVPALQPEEVKACLIAGAERLDPPGWNPDFGHGLLSAEGAHKALQAYR